MPISIFPLPTRQAYQNKLDPDGLPKLLARKQQDLPMLGQNSSHHQESCMNKGAQIPILYTFMGGELTLLKQ